MASGRGLGFLGRTSERRSIDDALARARDGRSAVLVIRGEPGIGKTALLRYAGRQALGLRVLQIEGVQAEMELPYAGIHRLCVPLLDHLGALPLPQQEALRVALGMASGPAPNMFLVAVAVLNLLGAAAGERPLLCLADDAQWLDATSLSALGFVARRLVADPVAIMFAMREPSPTPVLDDLPRLLVRGLDEPDAHALLARAVPGRLDGRVRDRIVGETGGNPLALLDLSRTMTLAERAGGLAPPVEGDLPGQLTQEYQRRVAELSDATRRLLLLASAEPLGDAALLWRAAERVSIEPALLAPANGAGLIEVDDHVRFRHPLVRAAVYRAASPEERRWAHSVLASVSDRERSADMWAWHLALAASGPDEDVAKQLESCARRAESRGVPAAAAALRERAVALTPDPNVQAGRALAAAEVTFQAGEFDVTQRLLAIAGSGDLDDFQRARVALLRGHVAAVSRYGSEAASMLLQAARRLEAFDLTLARRAYLTAWSGAITAHHLGGADVLVEVCRAVRALPPLARDAHPLDVVIDAFALLVTDGHAVAMPLLQRAGREILQLPAEDVLRWGWQLGGVRSATWDDDAVAVYERQARLVREAGALAELPVHLQAWALEKAWRGDLAGAQSLVAEAESIAGSTGQEVPPFAALRILALQGRESEATLLIDTAIRECTAQGQGIAVMVAYWASAVLNNGLGRFELAAAAADEVVANGILPWLCMWSTCELIEASVRSGDDVRARDALERLVATTRPASSNLARGIEARCRALLAGDDAETLYGAAIAELGRSGNRTELARAHLLLGEWLHGQGRLRDARERLRAAEERFSEIGMEAFAVRAGNELVAAGGKPRTRPIDPRGDLTPQEEQIAQLARDGLTNGQIGVQLFLSPRTVEWHLHKAFAKLQVDSRDSLDGVLPPDNRAPAERD